MDSNCSFPFLTKDPACAYGNADKRPFVQSNVRAHARAQKTIDRGATLLARRGGARG